MAEFIHTADWHLGNPFSAFDPEKRKRLRHARFLTIETILLYARKNRIPLVLCAGDAMDNGQVVQEEDLYRLLRIIGKYPEIRIIMIAGNHDPLIPHNIYGRIDTGMYPENMQLIKGDEVIEIPGMDLLIFASSLRKKHGDCNPLHWIAGGDHERISIGLAHGSIMNAGFKDLSFPIEPDFARSRGLEYLALGDWHSYLKVNDRTYYPGTPEPLQFGDEGFALKVRIERKGDVPQVEPVMEIRQYAWIEEERRISDEQFDAFKREFESVQEREIKKLTISGFLSLDRYKIYKEAVRMNMPRYHNIQDHVCIRPDEDRLLSLADGYMKDIMSRLIALKDSQEDLSEGLFEGLLSAQIMSADDFTRGISGQEIIDQAILNIYKYFHG